MAESELVIIGAGVGGYVAAIRAAQLGLAVTLVERRPTLGGTCLNVGCIPSKALLESSELYAGLRGGLDEHGIGVGEVRLDLARLMQRKEAIVRQLTEGLAGLMKKNRVTVLAGQGRLDGPGRVRVEPLPGDPAGAAGRQLPAAAVVLATGSEPVPLPFLPFDGERVVSSTEALAFDQVPGRLIVIGAGAVGLELGSVWRRLGAQVTVVELLPRLLPWADRQVASALERALKPQGIELRLATRVTGARLVGAEVLVSLQGPKGEVAELAADRVLVAVGRRPCTAGLGLETVGIVPDAGGRVPVDADLQTTAPGVYAIGDLVAGPMLAHKASHEGVAVAERIAGQPGRSEPAPIPNVVYTHPELAAVGLTEEEARERGLTVKIGRSLFRGNGRALTLGQVEGLVKVVAEVGTNRLLGVHLVGPRASDLIAEAAVALAHGVTVDGLAAVVHAHPTLAEALHEAVLDVDKRAIHA
ncbi:MAG: dihydrolipoyl dehydrogenase [Myxococcota bacterium]|jgi:dihydrolipoamide dehydrogenase|nr:dihydrolipoyl dehydrogenase [Myxococcota bacterium]